MMATLEKNIKQAIADFDAVKAAIEEKGVKVPAGTDTRMYGSLISTIGTGEYDRGYAKGYEDGLENGRGSSIADAIIDRTIVEIESNASKVEDFSLQSCGQLTRAIFPNAAFVGDSSIRSCPKLTTVSIPNAEELQGHSFRDCSSLEEIDLPKVTRMYTAVFQGCANLKTVILRANAVCSISASNVFTSTPIANGTGHVYVPDELVDRYKSAANWSNYANQIKPLSELED